ncbi:MAG: hypothetical protein GY755_10225 [Chloroflexi bacterium]|nr:hypothetical protein [Chloroflexota bacterium]
MSKDKIKNLYESGASNKEIASATGKTEKSVDSLIYRMKKNGKLGERPSRLPKSYIEHRQDGSVSVSRLLAMSEEDTKSPDRVVELCGFDPKLWDIVRCRVNDWNGMGERGAGQIVNHQVKVDLKPKKDMGISFDDIDEYFSNKVDKKPIIKVSKGKKGGRILELVIADPHIGSRDFDIFKRIQMVVQDVITETSHIDIEKIFVVFLGDTLHYDTFNKTTTRGTIIDYGMLPYEMYDAAAEVVFWVVETLAKIAPVELIGIYGNHDRQISYALFKGVSWYYRGEKNITVDADRKMAKYREFGNCLSLWHHGDMQKKRLESLVMNEAREAFGRTKFAEIHSAHNHSVETRDLNNGVIVRQNPTIAAATEWEVLEGYAGLKSSVAYVWDKEKGIKNIIQTNL